jgi:hypothetical protein
VAAANADDADADTNDELRTDLHMFAISDPDETSYVGSGSVPGSLLGQFALSEFDGSLRVASTTQPAVPCCIAFTEPAPPVAAVDVAVTPAPAVGAAAVQQAPAAEPTPPEATEPAEPAEPAEEPEPAEPADAGDGDVPTEAPAPIDPSVPESMVTVLQPSDGQLVQVGQVRGLGRGQQIYAVRMIGEVGYVVTFQRTDPLYTLDLSDPANPAVVGELEIPGYSAYLHPVGDGLLLGVGQDATDTGQVTGAQVSLFDVSDPAHPTRLDQVALDADGSAVEYDHRAFLHWEPTGLTLLPVTTWPTTYDAAGQPSDDAFFGAVGLRVDTEARRLETVGRIAQPAAAGTPWDGRSQILRSLVVGDHVLTVAASGVQQSDLTSLAPQSTLNF